MTTEEKIVYVPVEKLDELKKELSRIFKHHDKIDLSEIVIEEIKKQSSPLSELIKAEAVGFAEWIRDKGYVRYWGNESPDIQHWCMQYSKPNRTLYTTSELFDLYLKEKYK